MDCGVTVLDRSSSSRKSSDTDFSFPPAKRSCLESSEPAYPALTSTPQDIPSLSSTATSNSPNVSVSYFLMHQRV